MILVMVIQKNTILKGVGDKYESPIKPNKTK